MADDSDKIRKVADSSALLLTSRLSAPFLVAICLWIAGSVVNLKTDMASLNAGVNATLAGLSSDVTDLKTRFNNLEANYENIMGGFSGHRSN